MRRTWNAEQTFARELIEIIGVLAGKLGKKHRDYRVDRLRTDTERVLADWLST